MELGALGLRTAVSVFAAIPTKGFASLGVVEETFGTLVERVARYTVGTGALLVLRADTSFLSLDLKLRLGGG